MTEVYRCSYCKGSHGVFATKHEAIAHEQRCDRNPIRRRFYERVVAWYRIGGDDYLIDRLARSLANERPPTKRQTEALKTIGLWRNGMTYTDAANVLHNYKGVKRDKISA